MSSKVIDNFLKKSDFDIIQKTVISNKFPVFFLPYVIDKNENVDLKDINFTHTLFDPNKGINSPFFELIYERFIIKLEPKKIYRIKVNCYPRTSRNITHKFHIDEEYSHKGAILSLNTCNGSTKIKGHRTVKSVENRLLLFDPSILHASVSCTDQKCRWNIIVNYS